MAPAGFRIPLFDSLCHPTLTGRWLGSGLDTSFATLDRELKESGFAAACAVGLAGIEGYAHEAFLEACRPYPALFPVAGLDPAGMGPLAAELDRIARMGFRAVKIHPRFSRLTLAPRELGAVFRETWARGLVTFYCTYRHTRIAAYPTADPFLDLVAALQEAPEAKIVLVHGGDVQVLRYAELVRFNDNLLLDLSFTLLKYRGSSLDADLAFLFRDFDRRIAIGTDHPELTHRATRARFEELAADLPEEKAGNLAHRNLAAFLGIDLGFDLGIGVPSP